MQTSSGADAPPPPPPPTTTTTTLEEGDTGPQPKKKRGYSTSKAEREHRRLQRLLKETKQGEQQARAEQRKPRGVERKLLGTKKRGRVHHFAPKPLSAEARHAQHTAELDAGVRALQQSSYEDLAARDRKNITREVFEERRQKRLRQSLAERDEYLMRYVEWQLQRDAALATEDNSPGLAALSSSSSSSSLSFSSSSSSSTPSSGTMDISSYFEPPQQSDRQRVEREFRDRYYTTVLRDQAYISRQQEEQEANERGERAERARKDRKCGQCGATMFTETKAALYVCLACGTATDMPPDGVKYSDRENYSKKTVAPYEPISHFREFLTRLEGAEQTRIPAVVVESVKKQCSKNLLNVAKNPDLLTYSRCRQFLRDEGYSRYFEHINQIIQLVTGRAPVRLTQQQRDDLTNMFVEVQRVYDKHKGNRKNMVSYSFTTYKCCQLLGLDHVLPFLPLFKDTTNLGRANEIWERICKDLNYEFINTI